MPLVRRATRDDAISIIDFQKKMAWETEKLKLEDQTVAEGVIAVFDDHSRGHYFVTEYEGKVVASLLITYEWSDWRNCNIWWLQSVYVMPEFRRKGLFTKMYYYIKELAEEQDIAGLRLYVESGNIRARETYESLGMSSGHYSFYQWMRR
jgi:GNAT superfamily N-acetyltransferase